MKVRLQNGAEIMAINDVNIRSVCRDEGLEVEVVDRDRKQIMMCLESVVVHEDMCSAGGLIKVPIAEGQRESTSNCQVGWRGILSAHKTGEF